MSGYKTFTTKIWITLCVLLLTAIGCDSGQRMLSPVVSELPTVNQPTTNKDESPASDIFADIEISSEPTIPSDADILESDRVFYTESEEIKKWDEEYWRIAIVNTATEAYQNEKVINFFNEVKEYAEKYCRARERPQPPEMGIYFKKRDERDAFKDSLPGGWTTELRNIAGKWWYLSESVAIVDGKAIHYTLHMSANQDPCAFENQTE